MPATFRESVAVFFLRRAENPVVYATISGSIRGTPYRIRRCYEAVPRFRRRGGDLFRALRHRPCGMATGFSGVGGEPARS